MHFNVLVKIPDWDDENTVENAIDAAMGPYQQGSEDYTVFEDQEDDTREEYANTTAEVLAEYPTFESYAEAYCGLEYNDGRWGGWYNPDGKWDWYEIGGRWSDTLPVKPGMAVANWCRGDRLDVKRLKKEAADRCREYGLRLGHLIDKGFINPNFEGVMRRPDYDAADSGFGEAFGEDGYVGYTFGRLYELGIWVAHSHQTNEVVQQRFDLKELLVEKAFHFDFYTHAVIDEDGEWHSHEWNAAGGEEWSRGYFDSFIRNVSDDTLLVMVDCHT